MTTPKKDIAVIVRREDDGKVFSEIRDRARDARYYRDEQEGTIAVVIDRQRGRGLDLETISNRAAYLAELLGLELVVDLRQPCLARQGLGCSCPDCVAKTKEARK